MKQVLYGIIYRIRSTIDHKVYIGQTTNNLQKRFNDHSSNGNTRSRSYIKNAILKYGKENFIIEQIDSAVDLADLNKKEKFWIKEYKSNDSRYGYNLTEGGNFCPLTKETRLKISKTLTGKPSSRKNYKHSEETKRKLSEARKGFIPSKESIEKTRKGNLGKKLSKEHIELIKKVNTGLVRSPETLLKMSAAGKRNPPSPEKIKKMHDATRGKPLSEAHKIKLSLIQKGKKKPPNKKASKPIICTTTNIFYRCIGAASQALKICRGSIREVLNGKKDSHNGLHFIFAVKN